MMNRPKNQHAASAAEELVQLMFSAWKKFCENKSVRKLHKTSEIPAFDKWRIHEVSKVVLANLGGKNYEVFSM